MRVSKHVHNKFNSINEIVRKEITINQNNESKNVLEYIRDTLVNIMMKEFKGNYTNDAKNALRNLLTDAATNKDIIDDTTANAISIFVSDRFGKYNSQFSTELNVNDIIQKLKNNLQNKNEEINNTTPLDKYINKVNSSITNINEAIKKNLVSTIEGNGYSNLNVTVTDIGDSLINSFVEGNYTGILTDENPAAIKIDLLKNIYNEFKNSKKSDSLYKFYTTMIAERKRKRTLGREVCLHRTAEGYFINDSLKKIRDVIQDLLHVKNQGLPAIVPNIINTCFNKYCRTRENCFPYIE